MFARVVTTSFRTACCYPSYITTTTPILQHLDRISTPSVIGTTRKYWSPNRAPPLLTFCSDSLASHNPSQTTSAMPVGVPLKHAATSPLSSSVRNQSTVLNHANTTRTRRPSAPSSGTALRRRGGRADTIRAYHPPMRPGWQPGAEPGIDTKRESEDDLYHELHQQCAITVVDFSDERMEKYELDNWSLEGFLAQPREDWVSCRWICVNGVSWDVIKLLGNYKNLHRLAIEDLINTKNRTKADWYIELTPSLASYPPLTLKQ